MEGTKERRKGRLPGTTYLSTLSLSTSSSYELWHSGWDVMGSEGPGGSFGLVIGDVLTMYLLV
jgi:hypothetical protein